MDSDVGNPFARWARLVAARPWTLILAVAVCSAALLGQLPDTTFDLSGERFLDDDDPAKVAYERFRHQFQRDQAVVVAVRPAEVFEPAFLKRLTDLHHRLERRVPHLADITSLVNARVTYGVGDTLVVDELLEELPATDAAAKALRERVLANPLYRDLLISADATTVSIALELETYTSLGPPGADELGAPRLPVTQAELEAAVAAIHAVVAETPGDDVILVVGGPAARVALTRQTQRDIALALLLSNALLIGVLGVLFRRISAMLLPLLCVSLALLATVGTMAWAGVPITLPIQALPAFLVAMGTCYSIHLLTLFYRAFDGGAERDVALTEALARCGWPLLFTSLTTAVGLASFVAADLAPVSHFGMFGPLGVILALLYTLVLLPALLIVLPLKRRPAGSGIDPVGRLLRAAGSFAAGRPRTVVAGFAALSLLALAGAWQLNISHHPISWFPEDHPVRTGAAYFDRHFAGSGVLEVVLDTGTPGGIYEPAFMNALAATQRALANGEVTAVPVGKALSAADVLKEINQALNGNESAQYRIPDTRALIAQEFLLFENAGSDDLEAMVDADFSLASLALRVADLDAVDLAPDLGRLEADLRRRFGETVDVTVTGSVAVNAGIFAEIIPTMARSYLFAFCAVLPLLVLLLGIRLGVLAVFPNVLPVLATLGFMGWFGFSIDIAAMMVGAIVLGVAVDDTIHFMHGFREDLRRTGDVVTAVRATLDSTGRALLATTIVLALAFLANAPATMQNVASVGYFNAFAITVALAADVLLAPALLALAGNRWSTAAAAAGGETSQHA